VGAPGDFTEVARARITREVPEADPDAMTVVFDMVRLVNLLVTDLEAEVHRPAGWSWAGFRAMFALWVSGPLEPAQLARLSGVSRASISSALKTLEGKGLIERSRRSDDGRVVTVELTPEGRRRTRAAYLEHNRRERLWLSDLEPAELTTLADLLHRTIDNRPGTT